MPVVSVIMPAYNAEKTIKRAIDSVLTQTFSDFELIIVDDGSKDNTLDIAKSYNDNRIVILSQTNSGPSIARNNGIKNSKGEFICFIDSDDWYETDFLKLMIHNLSDDTDLVICNVNNIYLNGIINSTYRAEFYTNLFSNHKFISLFKTGIISPCWNKIYRKKIIEYNRLSFKAYYFAEDITFNVKYLKHISSVKVLEQSLYNYTHTQPGVTHLINEDHYKCYENIHSELLKIIDAKYSNEINEFAYQQYISISLKFIWYAKIKKNKDYYKTITKNLSRPLIKKAFKSHKCNSWKEWIIHKLMYNHKYYLISHIL